jgi:hypothetical protein
MVATRMTPDWGKVGVLVEEMGGGFFDFIEFEAGDGLESTAELARFSGFDFDKVELVFFW